jgi:hypothetical protein
VFGRGIKNIDLQDLRGPAHGFTHILYWSLPEGHDWTMQSDRTVANALPHIQALHNALNLLDMPDNELSIELTSDNNMSG